MSKHSILGAMAYSLEHKVFLVQSYYRNGVKVDGKWTYSLQDCMEEFRIEFPNIAIDYMQFKKNLDRTIKLAETGSLFGKTNF